MKRQNIENLLTDLLRGERKVSEVLEKLESLPFEDLGIAKPDNHRQLRRGMTEAIFCRGKSSEQISKVFLYQANLEGSDGFVMATRAKPRHFRQIKESLPDIKYFREAEILFYGQPVPCREESSLSILTAGTSDISVAEEAAVTAELLGNRVSRIYDVGVSGLVRLLSYQKEIRSATVLIVVAGMDGALPGVVSGLTSAPIIAVPTSRGYGASFMGVAALLNMLNCCSPGVSVVNIDNGYGAACSATLINRKILHAVKNSLL